MQDIPLPFPDDAGDWFAWLADEPWALWLDSGGEAGGGRFDILLARPRATLVTRGALTEIQDVVGTRLAAEDPFDLVRVLLGGCAAEPPPSPWPFAGGAVGYFGYDLVRRIERLPPLSEVRVPLPDMALGLFDWALVCDREQRRAALLLQDHADLATAAWARALAARLASGQTAPATGLPFSCHGPMNRSWDAAAYAAAFARVQRHLRAGDCYQVNLALQFEVPVTGDAFASYRRLRQLSPSPMGAYLRLPFARVLSASPERFLSLTPQGRVRTDPIKGTRRRQPQAPLDALAAQSLLASAKDRAENLMIVDLLRNDLGRVCQPGSVGVPRLCALESFASVHHLVSTVTGQLAPGQDATSLLRACFPGGSITGAPKLAAMRIIEALEPWRRGLYCGAIGWLGYDGAMDSSIAIRGGVEAGGVLRFAAGGGLVADSTALDEYQECLDKAAAFFRLLSLPPL
jgi:para-aminobenzoate synthetase component 1